MIDPRGHRFGAAISVVVLALAFLVNQPMLVAVIAVALGVSAALGTRYSILGRPWPLVRRTLKLGPVELEHEYPPRFAQAMGATFLAVSLVAFALGLPTLAWLLVAAVAGLQVILAATGFCLGCRLYFLKWLVPALFARAIGGGQSPNAIPGARLRRPEA